MTKIYRIAIFGAAMALSGCAGSTLTPQAVTPVAQTVISATGLQSAVSKACGFVGDLTALAALITANPLVGTVGGFVSMVCNGLTSGAARKSGAPAVSIANGTIIRGHWK